MIKKIRERSKISNFDGDDFSVTEGPFKFNHTRLVIQAKTKLHYTSLI